MEELWKILICLGNTLSIQRVVFIGKKTKGPRAPKGSRVGYLRKDGYYGTMFNKKSYLVHRIIFGIVHGYLPEVVDHKDHDRTNNLISNLREADYSKNIHNARLSKSDSTGVKGVRKTKNGRFECRVAINGVTPSWYFFFIT